MYRQSGDLSSELLEAAQASRRSSPFDNLTKQVSFDLRKEILEQQRQEALNESQSTTVEDNTLESKIARSRTWEIMKDLSEIEDKWENQIGQNLNEETSVDNDPEDGNEEHTEEGSQLVIDIQEDKQERIECSTLKDWIRKFLLNAMFAFIILLIVLPTTLGYGGILTQHPKLHYLFPVALKLCIFSNIIHQIAATSCSSLLYNVANVQTPNVMFLSLMATIIVEHSQDDSEILPTLLFVFALTSVLMGIVYVLIGKLNLVSVVQYIPYPVMAGFLAAVGVYLFNGGISIMTGLPMDHLSDIPNIMNIHKISLILPGLLIAILLMVVEQFKKHFTIMPTILITPVLLFWVMLSVTSLSFEDMRKEEFLFPAMETVPFYSIWQYWDWSKIQFGVLPHLIPNFITMVVLNILNTTLNVSGLEFELSKRIDSGRELAVAGLGNILAGFTGCIGGSVTYSLTTLGGKNGNNRLMGFLLIAFQLILFLMRFPIVAYIPKFFFGSVLIYLGASTVVGWLYKPFFSIPIFEYILLIITAFSILFFGNNVGLPVSIAISALFFAFQYSLIKPIRKTFHGIEIQSKTQRPYVQRKILTKNNKRMVVVQLQGYLFFGSTVQVMKQIRKMVDDDSVKAKPDIKDHWKRLWTHMSTKKSHKYNQVELDEVKVSNFHKRTASIGDKVKGFLDGDQEKKTRSKLSYIILDFSMVHGVDSTAVSSFMQIVQLATSKSIMLIFTALPTEVERMFRKRDVITDDAPKVYPDLDFALEWCENKIIRNKVKSVGLKKLSEEFTSESLQDYHPSFVSLLANFLPENIDQHSAAEQVNKYFEKKKLKSGEALFHSGDMANSVYFVKSGELSYYTHSKDGEKSRLFKSAKGTFAGETAMFLGVPHYLSLEADEDSTVFELTKENFKKMESEAPYIAHAVYTAILQSLSLTFNILVFSIRSLR